MAVGVGVLVPVDIDVAVGVVDRAALGVLVEDRVAVLVGVGVEGGSGVLVAVGVGRTQPAQLPKLNASTEPPTGQGGPVQNGVCQHTASLARAGASPKKIS